MEFPSPSQVMYSELKFSGISNRNAARTLVKNSSRVDEHDNAYISRYFVNVDPGQLFASDFADFAKSSYSLVSTIVGGKKATLAQIYQRLAGECADEMCESLRVYGLDDALYRNAVIHVQSLGSAGEADKAMLLMFLLIATGCLGDPRTAVACLEDQVAAMTAQGFRTTDAYVGDALDQRERTSLVLYRTDNGRIGRTGYVVPSTPGGCVIGSMAKGEGSITDVGIDVSREHARIWCDLEGRWLVQGLGSRNGVTVVSGVDRSETVVEPPRSERAGAGYPPFEIFAGDTIVLSESTRFLVFESLD